MRDERRPGLDGPGRMVKSRGLDGKIFVSYYSLQKAVSLNLFRVLNSTMAKGLPFPPPAPPSPCRAPVYYAPKCYVVSSPPPSRCCRPHSTSPQYRGPFTALL